MRALAEEVRALHDQVLAGGGPQYVERHRGRGKMMVRERLEALVDPGTPVLELCPLAGLHTGDPVGGGVVVALAEIAHTQCLVIANDPTVRGGTTSPTTIRKLLRAMDVAEENRLPVVILVESGGADLPRQADVFVPGGEQFRRLTQLSAQGIPTVCVVFGSSTAGGAYLPGMSDYTVMVEDRARVFLGGPPLVKMAIGEEADEEELGGARRCTPARRACATTWPVTSPRRCTSHVASWPICTGGVSGPARRTAVDEPLYPAEELLGIASVDVRVPFDVREILGPRPRRLPLRGVQGGLRAAAGLWLGVHRRLPGRCGGQQRHPLLARGAEGRPVHRPVQPDRHPDPLRAEHHRVHGRHALRAGRDHQGRRQADQRGLELHGAPSHPHGRRQLRRGQLRHGRAGLRPPLHLHLAQPPHRGDGAQATGGRPLHRPSQCGRGGGAPLRRGGRRGAAPGHREPDRGGVDRAVRNGPAVGRRHHRPAPTRARCSPSRSPRCTRRRCRGRPCSGWCVTDGNGATAHPSGPRRQPGGDRPASHQGRARRRLRRGRRLRRRRCRQPVRRGGRRRRAVARRDAGRHVPEPGRARRCRAGRGRRCVAPGLRLPVREPRTARGVRRGRHRVGGAAARGDAGHGPQGAGEGGRGRRRRPGAAERHRGRRGIARCAARRRCERRLPAPGQGLGRGRGPGDAPGARAGRARRRRRLGTAGSRRRVRLGRRVPGALPRRAAPHRGRRSSATAMATCCTCSTGSARCSAGTRRWSRRRRPCSCPSRPAARCGTRPWRRRGPSTTWASARSSTWSTRAASTSSR